MRPHDRPRAERSTPNARVSSSRDDSGSAGGGDDERDRWSGGGSRVVRRDRCDERSGCILFRSPASVSVLALLLPVPLPVGVAWCALPALHAEVVGVGVSRRFFRSRHSGSEAGRHCGRPRREGTHGTADSACTRHGAGAEERRKALWLTSPQVKPPSPIIRA